MSADPRKSEATRAVNLGKAGPQPASTPGRPGMPPGRKRAMAIGLIAAGGMSIFAFTPRERCEIDPVTGQQRCTTSTSSSSGSSSHGGSGSSRSSSSSWGFGSSGSDSGSGHSAVARGGFGSSGGLHFSGGG